MIASRRCALLLLVLAPLAPAATLDPVAETASSLRERLARGEVTAAAVTDAYLTRIAAVDAAGPGLNAIIEVNPAARAIAAALDERFRTRGPAGPLHGLPVVLKANIDTGDGMATSAGSLALADHRAAGDAFLVARLREAGAVILGKANLSEWANFRSNDSTSGWSSAGGQTANPYVLDRNPCGSSSGSAVAVAASLASLAVGTETNGSIICPSGINGIVGIKPTVGTVSRHGIIPIAQSQDTAGPMAKTVADAALLLAAMAAYDPGDPGARRPPAGAAGLAPDPAVSRLDGKRIGVLREYFGAGEHPPLEAVYDTARARLGDLGAVLVDPLNLGADESVGDAEYVVLLHEFKAGLNAYLAGSAVPDDRNTLAELIVWNRAHGDAVMPIFGQDIFLEAEATAGLDSPDYRQALADSGERLRALVTAAFDAHRLDALVAPSNGPAWKTDWVGGDRFTVGSSYVAAITGYPSITVPAGYVSGLPVGVSFVGRAFQEPVIIQIAHTFERAHPVRREPGFLPTIER